VAVSSRTAICLCCGALAAAFLPLPARGQVPVSLIHETRVTLDLRFDLLGTSGVAPASLTLSGAPGQTLSVSRVFDLKGGPLRLFVALTPDPDPVSERCRVHVVSDARWAGAGARIDRIIDVRPDRLTLIDLWSAPSGQARLVAGLTATWASRPRVVPVVPGHEPVEFVIEAQYSHDGQRVVVDQRHLSTLIGSPVRYMLRHSAQAGAVAGSGEEDAALGGSLTLELDPRSARDGELEVAARASLESDAGGDAAEGTPPARREAMTTDRLLPASALEIVLPLAGPGQALVFRVTAYF
jgi:hypothetical protein